MLQQQDASMQNFQDNLLVKLVRLITCKWRAYQVSLCRLDDLLDCIQLSGIWMLLGQSKDSVTALMPYQKSTYLSCKTANSKTSFSTAHYDLTFTSFSLSL